MAKRLLSKRSDFVGSTPTKATVSNARVRKMAQRTVLETVVSLSTRETVGSSPTTGTMGKKNQRYCIRANPPKGWQIWDRKLARWWGKPTKEFPYVILQKLNEGKQSELKY